MPVTSSARQTDARLTNVHPINARQGDVHPTDAGPTENRHTDSSGAARRPGRALASADRGAWSATSTFPPLDRNVGRSRRMARTALASWGASHLADSAELLVSELVTNAVRYGGGAISVTLALTGSALHISVADFGSGLPTPRDAADDDSNGRGLAIVTALCEQWTVTTRLTGKTVSCRLDLPI